MAENLYPPEELQLAQQAVTRFVERHEPSYRLLLYHAALPLVLTPELLNYLRTKFLQAEVPWEAEADLLLSDLCRQVGYEQYVMEPAVRAYLLQEMKQDPTLGQARMEAVARLLIHYVQYLARNDAFAQGYELQAQQWAAMVYLDNQSKISVQQMAETIKNTVATQIADSNTVVVNHAELVRLMQLVKDLASALEQYPELLAYAADVAELFSDTTGEAVRKLNETGKLQQKRTVLSIALPSLIEILPRKMRKPIPWNLIFNLFDPFVPVSGDNIKTWFVEREHNPLPKLELALRPNRRDRELKVLLAGQRGCGKTSELFRLISQMQKDYYIIYTDLFAAASQETVSAVEVFFSLGAAIYKVAQADGLKPIKENWEQLVSSLYTLFRERSETIDLLAPLKFVLATSAAAYPPIAPLAEAGRALFSGLKISRKDLEKIELEPVLREVVTRVNTILSDVSAKAGKPVLLIVDGLDKIRRLEPAVALFRHTWAFTSLPCQAVYLVPPILYYSVRFQEIGGYFSCEELPNVRLHIKGQRDCKNEEGWRTMQRLVEKRLQTAALDGTQQVFTSEALELLVEKSGGVIRDMIELIRSAALEAELLNTERIELRAAQNAIANMRRKIQSGFFREDYEACLDFQRKAGTISKGEEIQIELMQSNLIVNYQNGGFWRDLHPLVVDILEEYQSSEL